MRLVGILPLQESKSSWLHVIEIRTLVSGAGPLFRHNLAASEQRKLLDLLVAHVKSLADELRVDYVSIGYPSVIEGRLAIKHHNFFPLRTHGFTETNVVGTYLDLRRSDADLLASVEKNCRYKIRKAEKDGVSAMPIETREDWLACESLNEQTMGKHKYSRLAMEVIWDEFISRGYASAYVAMHGDRAVSVEVIQTFNDSAYLWTAFNARPMFAGANNYLIWHCIQDAKQQGLSFFLMGTYEFSDDAKMQGISDFKKSFGGTPFYVLGGILILKRIKHGSMLLFSELSRPALKALKDRIRRRTDNPPVHV